jgi:putative CocE/NonD family hydrolase
VSGIESFVMRRVVVCVVALASMATIPLARAATPARAPVRQSGYLAMADGVRLRYTIVRPAKPGRYPTLFEYSGYDPGTNPDAAYIDQFVVRDGGYAYIGVNLRGTGCSEGTMDFFQPQEARDGARVIDWVTHQPWSSGKVGMIGKSYPGITQLFVAEQQPPGLAAIAPGHFFGDVYRDIARPGGVMNDGFSSLWSFVGRPSYEFQSSPRQVAAGDAGCARGSTAQLTGLPKNPFVQLLQHEWDDALTRERSPVTHVDRIRVPMLATLSWQDEQLGSRNTDLLSRMDDMWRTNWWATLTNGDHGMARTTQELSDLERFFDHFLKGEHNGWEKRPRVQVWWESGRSGARAPGWMTGLDHWSEDWRTHQGRLTPWALDLRTGGRLSPSAPGPAEGADAFLDVGGQSTGNPKYGYAALPDSYAVWDKPPPKGSYVAYTSAPFATDRTFLGSGSADLWLSSTAPDTDVEVMLTEVRPDGREVYLQKGWLDASHRALDPRRSTALRPYQTHQPRDAANLKPGQPTLVRVEVFPFGAVIRKGSRLRLWVQAPTPLPELWAFAPSPYPAVDTVLHDARHVSRLVLPLVPNDPNRVAAFPTCGSLIRQPCRADPL